MNSIRPISTLSHIHHAPLLRVGTGYGRRGIQTALFIWLLGVMYLTAPIADTLFEANGAHISESPQWVSTELMAQSENSAVCQDSHPHHHQDNQDCPASHNHTHCDCLCCPGHIVAISSPDPCSAEANIINETLIAAALSWMRLPAGVQTDVYRPPQQSVTS